MGTWKTPQRGSLGQAETRMIIPAAAAAAATAMTITTAMATALSLAGEGKEQL